MHRKTSVSISILIFGLILIPSGFAQHESEDLFQFSRYWQQEPTNETSYNLNLDPGILIDETDLLQFIEGWHTPVSVPEIAFLALPAGGPAPLQVEFRYADPLGEFSIQSWAWDFQSDGIVDSTASNPIFLYETPGSYSITLSIKDAQGQEARYHEADMVIVRERVPTEVASGVVVIDNETCLAFISKTEDELILEQHCIPSIPLATGIIVVGSEDGGYARRVLSISENGSQLILQTENVALSEIFNNADISGMMVFTPEDLQKAGFKILADGKARRDFDYEIHAGVKVKGSLEFDPSLDFDCNIGWGEVKYFRAVYVGTLAANFEADIRVEGGLHIHPGDSEVSLLPRKIEKWGWYQIGPVPVIIYSEFDFKAGLAIGVNGDLGLKAGYNSATTVRFGAEYNRGDVDPWRVVKGVSLNTHLFGPEFYFDAGGYAKVYLKPEAKLRLYKIVGGPSAAVEAYLRGDIQFTTPQGIKLTAGIDTEVGFSLIDLKSIGINFDLGLTGKFPGPKRVLGQWPLSPPSSEPAVPAFNAAPLSGQVPLTVQFTDQSDPGDGTITRWEWDFGDGYKSTTQHPSHVYQNPGMYRVLLHVVGTEGSAGWAAAKNISVNMPGGPPVVSSFSLNDEEDITFTRIVTLYPVVTANPSHYMVSESSDFSDASWIVYSPPEQFVLSSGDGVKTIYFKARNAYGESEVVSDTISVVTDFYVSTSTGSDEAGDGSMETPWKTISHAVAEATGTIDTTVAIHVAAGIYNENLQLSGYQSLMGGYNIDFSQRVFQTAEDRENPAYATIVDGGQNGSVITFPSQPSDERDASLEISGCTIRNGSGKYGGGGGVAGRYFLAKIAYNTVVGNSSTVYGGGLYDCDGPISDNIITGNSGKFGGGLGYCEGTISGNTITGNYSSTHYGGGLYDCDGPISDNIITGNSAICGGGLYDCDGPISGNTISENSGYEEGGGLSLCDGVISENNIVGNLVVYFGGGLCMCNGTILNNTITENAAIGDYINPGSGGGISHCYGAIIDNTITKNSSGIGGGVGWVFSISGGLISGNYSSLWPGGGVAWDSSEGESITATVTGNTCGYLPPEGYHLIQDVNNICDYSRPYIEEDE